MYADGDYVRWRINMMETLAKRRQRTIRRVREILKKFLADRGKTQIENITDYYDWIELPKC